MAKTAKRIFLFCVVFLLIASAALTLAYREAIPDSFIGEGNLPSYPLLEACSAGGGGATDTVRYDLFGLLPLKSVKVTKLSDLRLIAGGVPFGIKFMTNGVTVVGFCDVDASGGNKNPSLDAGLRLSDTIKSVNGRTVMSAEEFGSIVEGCGGSPLKIIYTRDGRDQGTTLTPAYSETEGKYKTGAFVRDSGAGIGTVTFIDPETLAFAGLGHGICDSESGRLVDMRRGSVCDVAIDGVARGEVGEPGEIKGHFSSEKKGSLLNNTECGVFGLYAELPKGLSLKPLEVASKNELRAGKAHLICTLDEGGPCEYEIEISNVDTAARGNKCFSVRVTDKRLLEKTGGIVQGMSGSPIIQNGKLVGAVTHVLINDPTTGYGIFIENMLNAAQMPMAKAS